MTVASVLGKIIGALYRVPLVGVLGAEGTGYYQSVFPVYSLLISLVSGGVTQAVSRLVAFSDDGDGGGARGVMSSALLITAVFGATVSVLLGALSPVLARVQGVPELERGYLVIAPAVLLSGTVSVIRGYYQGTGRLAPTAISQLAEQVAKLAVGLTLSSYLISSGVVNAVYGALAGVVFSELVALVYLAFTVGREGGSWTGAPVMLRYNFARTLRNALPMTLGGIIAPLSHFLDSFIIVNVLTSSVGRQGATSSYGLFSGAVSSLVHLPVVLTLALSLSVVATLSRVKKRDYGDKLSLSLRISLSLAILFFAVYISFPKSIASVLYPSLSAESQDEVARLLALSSGSVIALSMNQIFTSYLQGVGIILVPVRNALVGTAVKVTLSIPALVRFGIDGAAVISFVGYALTAVLNVVAWQKYCKKGKPFKNVSRLLPVGGIILLIGLFAGAHAQGLRAVIICVLLAVIYAITVIRVGVFSREECKKFPLKGIVLAIRGGGGKE